MPVELIITEGSQSGTVAPIHPGYYLVGRHQECQIRPKSRSVSRKHCLLLHNEDGFGALDLDSTGGTFVNGTRLEPHQWRVLVDGDQVRFGKVAFAVAIRQAAAATLGESAAATLGESAAAALSESAAERRHEEDVDSSSLNPPLSWQNNDIASFLADEDAAEFAEHYGVDRENSSTAEGKRPSVSFNSAARTAPSVSDRMTGLGWEAEAPLSSLATVTSDPRGESEEGPQKASERDAISKKRPRNRRIDPKEYKRAPRRSISLPGLPMSGGERPDWKLIGSVALVFGSISLFAFQIYSHRSGSQIEVRQDLD